MTKFMANIALIALSLVCTLGNFWFTYGIWPKSWMSFVGFGVATIALVVIRMAVDKES